MIPGRFFWDNALAAKNEARTTFRWGAEQRERSSKQSFESILETRPLEGAYPSAPLRRTLANGRRAAPGAPSPPQSEIRAKPPPQHLGKYHEPIAVFFVSAWKVMAGLRAHRERYAWRDRWICRLCAAYPGSVEGY